MNFDDRRTKSMPKERHEEQDVEIMVKVASLAENKVEVNGELGHGESSENLVTIDNGFGVPKESGSQVNGGGICVEKEDGLSSNLGAKPTTTELAASKPTPTKGYGLKKWRRIRRDPIKDGSGSTDSALILKRRLSLAEPAKAHDEHKLKSVGECEDSVASVGSGMHAATPLALDPELGLLVASAGFSIGADSENSDEQSSKSSTAATAPRLRHETGFGRERNRMRSYGGRGMGHAVQQRGQRGRGGAIEAGKKSRGDRVKFEKENSLSSVESDLRSSNAPFARWGSVVSSRRQVEMKENYDEEHNVEARASEEVRSGYYENGEGEDTLQEDLNRDLLDKENAKNSKNHQSQLHLDPFLESIVLLQATQEALENEIQMFGKIGKQPILTCDDSCGQFEETEGSNSPSLEAHLTELNEKIESLQHKLEEASANVKEKESKVLELEAIINSTRQSKKETGSNDQQFLKEKREEMEYEYEKLHKKKMEAEIEYLIIARTTQSLKVLSEDHMAFFEEQRSLAEDQKEMISKLRDAEGKAILLKKQAEELETSCKELLATEEILKLQNNVCKLSMCTFIQLMMVCIAFGFFLMQLLPPSSGVAPT